MADDQAISGEQSPIADWPPRPWILAGLLALAGLLIFLLTDGYSGNESSEAWRGGLVGFVFFGFIAATFSLGPKRLIEPAIFAVLAGAVMGGLAFHAIRADDAYAGPGFAFAAGVFASVIALPLFQAGFHRTRFATDYVATHFHVWTDAVSAGGALVFVGLSWVMLFLLNGLLGLVGLDFIGDLMDEGWFGWMWSGGAFGAALGVLRNNLKVIGAMQSVVLIVLSMLAVPLALALLIFLVALLISGGAALWEATDAATPILLTCALGCFVLANAIMRDTDEARTSNRVLQSTALILSAGILPLAIFAAISMGIRIDQYGLAPERIWALVAIIVAVAYGAAYWAGLARGRLAAWSQYLRRANLHLAAVTCVLALFLALPILDFGGISARNQVSRLEAGKVELADFDFDALRWDFGDAGRAVLDRLAAGEGETAALAVAAQAQEERTYPWQRGQRGGDFELRVQSDDPEFRQAVLERIGEMPWVCPEKCVAIDLGVSEGRPHSAAIVQRHRFEVVTLDADATRPQPRANAELKDDSVVEIRTVEKRYVFVDGVPMSIPLDDAMDMGGTTVEMPPMTASITVTTTE